MIEKINHINKMFIRETRCIAKADVLMEFLDAYKDMVKWDEERGEEPNHELTIYSLQEQMWAFYTEEAIKAGAKMREVAEA
tara:strand:- start:53 stop:295 length:243 start_codon:yes stop_codon:yes gene_type:complete